MSLADGAFALLGTGSVEAVKVHRFGAASFRQPVTLTISTLFGAAGAEPCLAGAWTTASRNNSVVMGPYDTAVTPPVEGPPRALGRPLGVRAWRPMRSMLLWAALASAVSAHDLEKTRVSITFARDGSFVAEVANDPSWLTLRRESIPGPFADRVVFWVDGREIRAESDELIAASARGDGLAVHRLRGRMPLDARTLRWYYGLVIDPYPLTVRRADGRLIVEEVQGDAWSRAIDLSGQFQAPAIDQRLVAIAIAALLLVPVALRLTTRARKGLSWLRLG